MTSKQKLYTISLTILTIWSASLYYTFATPPTTPYNVAETLDPTCTPGSTNCYVKIVDANNGLTLSGTNTVQLGGTLIQDTVVDQAGKNFSLMNGNVSLTSFSVPGFKGIYLSNDTPGVDSQNIGIVETGTGKSINLSYNSSVNNKSLGFSIGDNVISMGSSQPTAPSSNIWSGIYIENDNGIIKLNGKDNDNTWNTLWQNTDESDLSGLTHDVLAILTNEGNWEWWKYPSTRDDSGITTPTNFLYTDGSGKILSAPTSALGGGSGWSLTGNSGTTAGTNFIGTTDAQDFMVKTNGNQIALFGQNGSISIGNGSNASLNNNVAIGTNALAIGIGSLSIATAFDDFPSTLASGDGATSIGYGGSALGKLSVVLGNGTASGDSSISLGNNSNAFSALETVMGIYTSTYSPLDMNNFNKFDRLFSIGNGQDFGLGFTSHNAYTLWKDGSFAYNDDNFQNDTPGTEQNMFYFNYGNHDGLGGVQGKRAVRLGSVCNTEADINGTDVGDRSIAIGFAYPDCLAPAPVASGLNAIAIGRSTIASGQDDIAFGVNAQASGGQSIAIGQSSFAQGRYSIVLGSSITSSGEGSIGIGGYHMSSGLYSVAIGYANTVSGAYATGLGKNTQGLGDYSLSSGLYSTAFSYAETALGIQGTDYIPGDTSSFIGTDRLFNLGNGNGSSSDAFTILKNGQTGIGIDNFETNSNGNIFQVGDGTTGIIGYVDNGTGNWMAVSDERKKHNITDIQYGLNEILQLKPVSFDYNRNNEHTIGFLAQQVLPIIPEAVSGDGEKGYAMSYTTLTPALVKAIQELNLKVDTLQLANGSNPTSVFDTLRNWLADSANGIRSIVVKEKICVDDQCLNRDDIRALLEMKNGERSIPPAITPVIPPSSTPIPTVPTDPVTLPTDPIPDTQTPEVVPPVIPTE